MKSNSIITKFLKVTMIVLATAIFAACGGKKKEAKPGGGSGGGGGDTPPAKAVPLADAKKAINDVATVYDQLKTAKVFYVLKSENKEIDKVEHLAANETEKKKAKEAVEAVGKILTAALKFEKETEVEEEKGKDPVKKQLKPEIVAMLKVMNVKADDLIKEKPAGAQTSLEADIKKLLTDTFNYDTAMVKPKEKTLYAQAADTKTPGDGEGGSDNGDSEGE